MKPDPYELITQDRVTLLTLQKKRRSRYFLFYRILPVLFILFALVFIIALQPFRMPAWFNPLPVLGLFVAAILILRNYVTELRIDVEEFFITKQFFFSREVKHAFMRKDIEKIQVKSSGKWMREAVFYLCLPDGEKFEFNVFPWWSAVPQHVNTVRELLSTTLSVPVEEYLQAS